MERQQPSRHAKKLFWDLKGRDDDGQPEASFQPPHYPTAERDADLGAIRRRITAGARFRQVHFYRPYLRLAGVVTLLLVAALALWQLKINHYDYRTLRTAYGETLSLRLPDGSHVRLNANSRLRFARAWQQGAPREVWLEGEGFFSVRPQQAGATRVPFRVYTDDLRVEVLGTRFNVSDRQPGTEVVLASGAVKINLPGNHDPPVLMKPGERVAYLRAERRLVRQAVEPHHYSAWTQGTLVLDKRTLHDVARLIEDSYGLKVHFQRPADGDLLLQGTLPANTLDELLEGLSVVTGLTFEKETQSITVKSK